MKMRFPGIIILVCMILLTQQAGFAAISTTQVVTYEVAAINEITVSGAPAALIINTATAGGAPNAVSNAATTYSVTTNQPGATITGSINSNMPANTTLQITLAAPTGGSSNGIQTLTTGAILLSTCTAAVSEGGLMITYNFSATAAAGVVVSNTKTVTLTVVP